MTLADMLAICDAERRLCGNRSTEWFPINAMRMPNGEVVVTLLDGTPTNPVVVTTLADATEFLLSVLDRRAGSEMIGSMAIAKANLTLCPQVDIEVRDGWTLR